VKSLTTTSKAMQWTEIVMDALAQATKHPAKRITIDVATEEAYEIIDNALFTLIADGNEAAWRIRLQKHTLH